ncbi:MAG: (Fe-S)-binding protein [Deltaproteobacteria bacterium]|nr:MAG: (Fe-S)-binding protein [Deltaproteobacteria bacterium]
MNLENVEKQFNQCNKCGLCLATCPVCKELLLEKYTPRGKILLARYYCRGGLDLSARCRDIFAECLLCGACSATCPSGVDLTGVFVAMREELAANKGLHPKLKSAVESLIKNHNISDEDNAERGEWRDDIRNMPDHMYERDRAEVVYFVGCVASFFPMVQEIPRNLVQILDSAGEDFTILAGEEWCCGFPLIGAGAPDRMKELIDHNLEKVKALGAAKIVFSCPSCLRTWKEYYNTDLELFHSTEFIQNLIDKGNISLRNLSVKVTYHDPCDLGRNGRVYEAPRQILKSIPGLTLVELEKNRAQSVCCGGGGNLEMADPELSKKVAQRKIEEIRDTGAEIVVTSCQQCVRTIKGMVRRKKVAIDVIDITGLVKRAIAHG